MVTLFLNGRKVKKFKNYEKARQYARKVIREESPEWVLYTTGNNPAIGEFGYSIRH